MNILIVDDHPSNLKLLRSVLEAEGMTVCEAADGLEALRMLIRARVDAIISDILMPRMDGYRLCMEVRANHRFCDLPFIAYTATYTSDRDEKLMTDIGADRFLRKPTSAAVLAATVAEVVLSKRRRPPTPARVRPETYLLDEYSKRLGSKLEERNATREANPEPRMPIGNETPGRHAQLQRLFDDSSAMVYGLKWENEKVIPDLISEAMSQFLGFTVAESASRDWWLGQLYPDDRVTAVASIFETLSHGSSRTEYRVRRKDGGVRWVEDQRRSIHNAAGQPVEFAGVWTDITERKKADATLLEQREQWRARIGSSTAAVFVVQDDCITLANTEAARITAVASPEDLIGRDLFDFVQNERSDAIRVEIGQARLLDAPQRGLEQKLRRTDGTLVTIETSTVGFLLHGQPAVLIEARDISEQKRAESRLALQSAVTAALAETASVSEINQKVLATLGAGLQWDFGDLWLIEHRTQVLRCTETWHVPSTEFHEFASESRALVFASGQGLPGRVWASGQAEWCSNHVNTAGLREWIGFPIKLRREIVGVLGFFSRKATRLDAELLGFFNTIGLQLGQFIERQQLADQLRQAQRMEAIGTLAGGIAHDFNNILGAIYGYCELARMEARANTSLTGHLDAIMGGARRATDLVGQILAFSRHQDQKRRPIQLQEITAETMRLLRAAVPAAIEFQISLANDAPAVLANATQVHQILMNLGTNAAHAMREHGGRLTVKLENCQVGPELAAAQPELRVGRYARLTVNDTGHGMDAETLERIYEPSFTTKPQGEGTGLGLAVVRGIVKAHDGAIVVSSQRAKGTTFQVYFPAHLVDVEEVVDTSSNLPRGGGERILFVDDEAALAHVGKLVLDHVGYVTDTCSNAGEAIDLVSADPAAYALVITDQMMPGMTGADLAQRLNAIRPDLPILLTTGCTDTLVPDRLRAMGVRQLLAKPISVQALAGAVHEVFYPTADLKPS